MLLHLGSLHAIETALLMLVAFGPFVVAAVVIAVARRRETRAERDSAGRSAQDS